MADTAPLSFGWEEWIALPELGLPAIRAKIDTGARTSALHASDIEPFGSATRPKVRFHVHPLPGREDLAIPCSARVVDRREVTSSNGESELRYVIATDLEVAGQSWPIEITLTNRTGMASRMLLGRQALVDHITITATERRLQPELSYDVYHSRRVRAAAPKRSLRIAVLSRENTYTNRRLAEVAEARGHTVEVIDTNRCYMAITPNAAEVHYDGKRLPRYDAVIPRIGQSVTSHGVAVIRQFETMGTYCVNPANGITASRDRLHTHQVLAARHIDMPLTAFAASPKDTANLIGMVGNAPLIVKLLDGAQGRDSVLAETRKAAESVIAAFRGLRASFLVQTYVREAAGEEIRCLVVAGKVVAALRRSGDPEARRTTAVRLRKAEREMALRAARAFRLGLAGVDLLRAADGPKVIAVSPSPGFETAEAVTGKDLVGPLYDAIEARARPQPVRRRKND
ncbi:MAG: RimK family alpha-L-glutamate ligase [Rhodobacteraceae bacterium]|nr:RimK family alpha-L-glutamate ligase [Paracoccaceae bacterium]